MRKAALWTAAVVALFLVLLVLVLPRLVSVDFLRPRVVAVLEEKTGRKVDLSGLSLSLFPGIGVKVTGLTVSGDPRHPGEPMLSVPETEIRLAIAPLLSGVTEFTKFILIQPKIRFRTYPDGTNSATDIVRRFAQEKKATASLPEQKGKEATLAVRSVRIERAILVFVSEEPGGRLSRWEISPISVHMSGVGEKRTDFEISSHIEGQLRGDVSFAGRLARDGKAGGDHPAAVIRGEGRLFGQKVAVTGKIAIAQEPADVDLEISFPGIGIGTIAGIFRDPPAFLTNAHLEGVVPLTVKVAGNVKSPAFEASADLTRAGGTVLAGPQVRKPVGTSCTIVAKGRYASDRVSLSNAEIRIPPLSVSANAVFHPASGARDWAASGVVSSLADAGKFFVAEAFSNWSPAGRLTASMRGSRKGTKSVERYKGSLDLDGVGFRVPGRSADLRTITGRITFAPRTVTFSRLGGLMNGKRFSLNGEATLGPVPAGEADLRIAYLDVDALFPPREEGERRKKKGAPPDRSAKELEREHPFSARVRLAVDAGKARGVEFTDLSGIVRYERGNVILDSLRAHMYGGTVTVSGVVGLAASPPDFRVKMAVHEVAAATILSREVPSLKDFLSGSLSLSGDLSGGMKDFADFSRTASGTGSFKITGGKIKGLDLLDTAVGLAGLVPVVKGTGALPGKETAKEMAFSDLSAAFRIEGGKIRTDSLRIVSEELGLTGNAAVGFDRSLDFRGSVLLSKELSKRFRGKAGKFLTGPQGEVEIPLILKGPLTSPKATLDTAALAKGAGERILKDLIGKMPGKAPPSGGDNAAPAAKPENAEPYKEMEDILRKFLPGKQR